MEGARRISIAFAQHDIAYRLSTFKKVLLVMGLAAHMNHIA